MPFALYTQVSLLVDVPSMGLRKGDVATIVERHDATGNLPNGYTLEVFNAVGETYTVVTLREDEIEALKPNAVLHVRPL
jgi:hypothetical protein